MGCQHAPLALGPIAEVQMIESRAAHRDDALGRLTDVKKHEAEKADATAWQAQPARQRQERERRLEAVRRTAKSFLDLGKASLAALLPHRGPHHPSPPLLYDDTWPYR